MSHASIRPDGGIAAQAIVCAAPLLGPYRQESLPNLVGRLEIRRGRIFAEHSACSSSRNVCANTIANRAPRFRRRIPRPHLPVSHGRQSLSATPPVSHLPKPIHEQIDPAPAQQRLSAPNYQSFKPVRGRLAWMFDFFSKKIGKPGISRLAALLRSPLGWADRGLARSPCQRIRAHLEVHHLG
jgi:hypothetical protein